MSEKDGGGGGGGGGGREELCQPEEEEDMSRRGRAREVGGAAGTARDGRGHLARKGERARAEENLRERIIEKAWNERTLCVEERQMWGMGIAGLGWKRKEQEGFEGF